MRFIDLFAGIGGFHLALKIWGAKCVYACEIDKYARQTYEANFEIDFPFDMDITKVDPATIPDHDILCAGFPCQPFSVAGLRKGFSDIKGTLFFNIIEILKYKSPRIVFLENVKGLINHDNGNTFKTILSELEQLGYKVYYKILNSKDFGIPQNRQRIFILGFNNQRDFKFPKPLNIKTKLEDILERKVDDKYYITSKLWDYYKKHKEANKKKGNGFGYKIVNQNETTPTLTAHYCKGGSEILILTDLGIRKLTPRECARLQGFPEDFKIIVSDSQAYKQFGNSVTINVIMEIFRMVKE